MAESTEIPVAPTASGASGVREPSRGPGGSPGSGSPGGSGAQGGPEAARLRGGQLIVGRLLEHGRAPYQFRDREDPSYYVKLLTSRGPRTLWGKDLERALGASETQPKNGDLVGARRVGRSAVTITARERDADGRVMRQEEHAAHRTRWVVEKVKFFAERARLARQVRDEQADARESVRAHPELKSTFISLRAAEEFAQKRIVDPAERRRFIEGVRSAMSASIQKGEPLPSVRLRDRAQRTSQAPAKAVPRKPEEPTR